MTEFKVGDVVRIINPKGFVDEVIGNVCKIESIDGTNWLPIRVKFLQPIKGIFIGGMAVYDADELEKLSEREAFAWSI